MSAICGVFSPSNPSLASREALEGMLEVLAPRGEERHLLLGAEAGWALGLNYRPAFLAPGEAPRPSLYQDGRISIVLEGQVFAWRHDKDAGSVLGTSVAEETDASAAMSAAAILAGQDAGLAALDGAFAFAAWEQGARRLTLVSDALGRTPLFYYYDASRSLLVFASELKAVMRHQAVPRRIDRDVLALLLRQGDIPWPFSLLHGARRMGPATRVTLDSDGRLEERAYKKLPAAQQEGDLNYWLPRIREQVVRSVERQTRRAAPLAVFNGGGTDSTVLLAALTEAGIGPVRSFTVGFGPEPSHDVYWAERVTTRLGIQHETVLIDPEKVTPDLVADVMRSMDEPVDTLSRWATEALLGAEVSAAGLRDCLIADGCEYSFGGTLFWTGLHRRVEHGSLSELPNDDEVLRRLYYASSMFDNDQLPRLLTKVGDYRALLEERRRNYEARLERGDIFDYAQVFLALRNSGARTNVYSQVLAPRFGLTKRPALKDEELLLMSRRIPGALRGRHDPETERLALKHAFADIVPDLLERRGKGAYPAAWYERATGVGEYLLQSARRLAETGLFKEKGLERYLGRYEERARLRDAERVSLLASLQGWLDNYSVDVGP